MKASWRYTWTESWSSVAVNQINEGKRGRQSAKTGEKKPMFNKSGPKNLRKTARGKPRELRVRKMKDLKYMPCYSLSFIMKAMRKHWRSFNRKRHY